MNFDNIKVELLNVQLSGDSHHGLCPFLHDEDYEEGVNVYLVSQKNNANKVIYLYKFKGPAPDAQRDFLDEFRNFVNLYPLRSIKDCIFFVDFFCPIRPRPTIFHIDKNSFTKNQFVDTILSDTYGYILYDYQLKYLVGYFYSSGHKIDMLAKGINIRDRDYENEARKLRFSETLTLLDVFNERCIDQTMRAPNVKGGRHLYETLLRD